MRALMTAVALLALASPAGATHVRLLRAPPSVESTQATCAKGDSPECAAAREQLAIEASNALLTVGATQDPAYRPLIHAFTRWRHVSVRAAAVAALGALGPTSADTPVLREALNDPVPLVRSNARAALGQSQDPAAAALADRARDQSDRKEPDRPPDAARLGIPVPSGATYLFFASQPGLAVFATPESPAAVERACAAKAARGATSLEQFRGSLSKVKQFDLYQELSEYERDDVYASPRFLVLDGTASEPRRFAVVYGDRVLNTTALAVHDLAWEPPAAGPGPTAGPADPCGAAGTWNLSCAPMPDPASCPVPGQVPDGTLSSTGVVSPAVAERGGQFVVTATSGPAAGKVTVVGRFDPATCTATIQSSSRCGESTGTYVVKDRAITGTRVGGTSCCSSVRKCSGIVK